MDSNMHISKSNKNKIESSEVFKETNTNPSQEIGKNNSF